MKDYICLAILGSLLSGCAAPGPKQYDIRANAEPVINRDATGKPLSIVVRLYQLKQPNDFNQLTFDLAASGRSDADILGTSVVQKNELILVPGAQFSDKELLAPETKYIGVIAFFRRPDTNYWHYLIDAEEVRKKGIALIVKDCYLSLTTPSAVAIPGQSLGAKPVCREDAPPAAANGAVPANATSSANKSTHAGNTNKGRKTTAKAPRTSTAIAPEMAVNMNNAATSVNATPASSSNLSVSNAGASVSGKEASASAALPPIEIRVNPGLNWSAK